MKKAASSSSAKDNNKGKGRVSSNSKTNSNKLAAIPLIDNSACCIIPPKSVWHQINAIRSQYDKSCNRWPPHMNLFFPFVPSNHFDEVSHELTRQLQRVEPFRVELSEIACNEDSKYLFLVPKITHTTNNNPFYEIVQVITKTLPQCQNAMTGKLPTNLQCWTPHLTLGQIAKEDIGTIKQQLQSEWESIQFEVNEISLISRNGRDDMFKTLATIKLGQTAP